VYAAVRLVCASWSNADRGVDRPVTDLPQQLGRAELATTQIYAAAVSRYGLECHRRRLERRREYPRVR
jgi:hypothetical protein